MTFAGTQSDTTVITPALYEGVVVHDRRGPQPHRLTHRIQMAFVDVSTLTSLTDLHPLWSSTRRRPVELRRSDCLGDPAVPLHAAVSDEVERLAGTRPTGPIALLATPRTFGWNFNPITSYYCFDEDGRRVESLLVEVTNTPWGERHRYVVGEPGRHSFAKDFHVSPFLPMGLRYELRYAAPDERLTMSFDVTEDGATRLRASMALTRVPPNRRAMSQVVLRPWRSSPGVSAAIYANAVSLVAKRATIYRHPEKKER